MKKKLFLLPLLVLPLLVAGCKTMTYTPRVPYPGIPEDPGTGPGGDDPGEPIEKNMVVNFYLNYSNSDTPIYTMEWWSLKALGECPEEAILTDADAPDPLYPKFLGYSEYPSSIDESHLWDFANDYKQSNILNLYGIWVAHVQ